MTRRDFGRAGLLALLPAVPVTAWVAPVAAQPVVKPQWHPAEPFDATSVAHRQVIKAAANGPDLFHGQWEALRDWTNPTVSVWDAGQHHPKSAWCQDAFVREAAQDCATTCYHLPTAEQNALWLRACQLNYLPPTVFLRLTPAVSISPAKGGETSGLFAIVTISYDLYVVRS